MIINQLTKTTMSQYGNYTTNIKAAEKDNAYAQCQNCHSKRFQLFGKIYCKQFGKQSVKELKEVAHCAGQSVKDWGKAWGSDLQFPKCKEKENGIVNIELHGNLTKPSK